MSYSRSRTARSRTGDGLAPARIATKADFDQIVSNLSDFWGERQVDHLHHPTAIEEFGDAALVISDPEGQIVAYLFGMILSDRRLAYVHVCAVRREHRGKGSGRRLYEAFGDLAAARGCQGIKAITVPSNTASIAFHRSLGMRAEEVADYSGPGRARVVFSGDLRLPATAERPPVPRVTVRAARAEDIDAVLAFWRVAAEDTDRPTDRREAIAELVAHDPTALLLALREDMIVGCVIAGWDGWRAHIYRLAVHPEHRRQGLATWLLRAAEAQLRDRGAVRIDAMVLDSNVDGHAMWTAADYQRQTNWSRWVKPVKR